MYIGDTRALALHNQNEIVYRFSSGMDFVEWMCMLLVAYIISDRIVDLFLGDGDNLYLYIIELALVR